MIPFTDMSCRGRSKETPSRVTCQWPYVHMYQQMKMTFAPQYENVTKQLSMLQAIILTATRYNYI